MFGIFYRAAAVQGLPQAFADGRPCMAEEKRNVDVLLVPLGVNTPCIEPALYASCTPEKLVVGPTRACLASSGTPSLRRRIPDADIRHYTRRIYAGRH